MVRLRPERADRLLCNLLISIPHGTIKTAQGGQDACQPGEFQFHMVRLRRSPSGEGCRAPLISIPHGTIKTISYSYHSIFCAISIPHGTIKTV